MRLLLSIYEILTVYIGYNAQELLVAALKMIWVVTVCEAVTGMSLAHLPNQVANSFITEVGEQAPYWLPIMRAQISLTLSWRLFSRWGRECVTSSFAYEGSQYLIYDCLQPISTQITQDGSPKIVEAPLTLISRMGQGASLSVFKF